MFKNVIPQPLVAKQPVAPQPVVPQPTAQPRVAPHDPDVEKLRLMMMKILVWVVGGSALALIIWRVVLKFVR